MLNNNGIVLHLFGLLLKCVFCLGLMWGGGGGGLGLDFRKRVDVVFSISIVNELKVLIIV